MTRLTLTRADNDLIWDDQDRPYIDLFSGHGATWIGHGHAAVREAVARQMERLWITGGLASGAYDAAEEAIQRWFPRTHAVAALYSTGMEAAEFALRLARVATGRARVLGFEHGMHGKSMATALLGWNNRDGIDAPFIVRLPFGPHCDERHSIDRLTAALAAGDVAAVFVEPLQASGGGYCASDRFCRAVHDASRAYRALLVFDEILTGFHRTGPPFYFSKLGFVPDVILIGKAMGNGFPVSGVVADRTLEVRAEMLPGSTYAGNPLAASAVAATLRAMSELDLPQRVSRIERAVREGLGTAAAAGISLRGRGALWVLELPPGCDAMPVAVRIFEAGVCVGCTGRQIRILPPATITIPHLRQACAIVAAQLRRCASAWS